MGLIPDEHKEQVKNEFKERLEKSVKILMFTQALECHFCTETRQLIQEFAAISMVLSDITVVGNSMLLRLWKPQKA